MKIKTNKEEILNSLQVAQYFIASGSTLPLLSNILFEADGDYLNLTATDMDISAKIKCKVENIKEEGKTTIPRKIIALIKEFEDGAEITIESDKNDNINLKCKKSSYKMPGLPAEDFPALQLDDKKLESVKISQSLLKEILDNIQYAALKDTSKRNLNGVFMKFEGNKIEAVATDAHRLAYYKAETKSPVKGKLDYIIPLKTINEVSRVLNPADENEITLNFYEKVIEFIFPNMEIVSRVIDENYPNYSQVIPKDFNMKALIKKEELAASIRRAAVISSDKSKIVLFKFENNKLFINVSTADEGEAFEEIDITYEGEPIEVSYNAVYIMDFLKANESENIEIKLISSMNPGVMKAEGKENLTYVIMPIRK